MALRGDQKGIIGASLLSLALWAFPLGRFLVLPLVYLNTHIHEICHALSAYATGGSASTIHVYADGSGVAGLLGGIPVVTASAGYVGAAVIGALIILFARTPTAARRTLATLGALVAISLLIWVRGDIVGVGTGIAWAVGLIILAGTLSDNMARFAAQFLGVQQCLTSIQALLTLLKLSSHPEAVSDAQILQQQSGISSVFWALIWAVFSLVAVGWALKTAWNAPKAKRA